MSNLDDVYSSCPGLMSDGRAQQTDYKSRNQTFKDMKGSATNSYEFRSKLQGSGLRDLLVDSRFNMCGIVPEGDISLSSQINLTINGGGSYLDSFNSLTSTPSAFLTNAFSTSRYPQMANKPVMTQPMMIQPVTQPVMTQPVMTQPVMTQPVMTQPVMTQPVMTQPMMTQPMMTQPVMTQPMMTQPVMTQPVMTQPMMTQPVVTQATIIAESTQPINTMV